MKVLLDLPKSIVDALATLSAEGHQPRAVLIREAIIAYLDQQQVSHDKDAFGLWKDENKAPSDGLEVQRALRAEW